MIKINLFKKEGVYTNLLIGTVNEGKLNMPLYNTDFTVWKGVDNTIEFSIRNHDRKSVDMSNKQLVFTMINQSTQQTFTKELETVNSALGRYKVTITNDESKNYDCGTFVGHVSIYTENGEELLYSGTDWYPYFNINIEPNRLEIVSEPIVFDMSSMLRNVYDDKETGQTLEMFVSSMIKSSVTPYHTFIFKLKEFVGEIIIQGSLQDTPQNTDDNWFDIIDFKHICTQDDEDFELINDNILLSQVCNSMWVRVVFKRPIGSDSMIEEVSYRN